jgi:DHA2 family multidrug resistance protein
VAEAATRDGVGAATWIGFLALCVAMFMAILDIQIVASSLTAIGGALAIAHDDLSWIQTAYLVAEVIAIPLSGWLTRALGLRWLMAGATLGFTISSVGCALAGDFAALVALRTVQGLFGGLLIPGVFTAGFTLFPPSHHSRVAAIAGSFAMIAPTIGPALGGWLTETTSWHWMFLVNLPPGLIVVALVVLFVRGARPDWPTLWRISVSTVLCAAVFLGGLELLLKTGPREGWGGATVVALYVVCPIAAAIGVWLCLTRAHPLVDLRRFRDRAFSLACGLNFVLGVGLYGSTYLLAVFLGLVRDLGPLEIGAIMAVTGAVQLSVAPLAAYVEPRLDPRGLAAFGFALFAAGLIVNGFTTPRAGFDDLFWPQVLRGAAMLLCLLPITRLALDGWDDAQSAEASGVFNLTRVLGGAIGIALIDTILERRTPTHGARLAERLMAGDRETAGFVGLPLDRFHGVSIGPVDAATQETVRPLVERAALTLSFNEAWLAVGATFALALMMVPLIPRGRRGAI